MGLLTFRMLHACLFFIFDLCNNPLLYLFFNFFKIFILKGFYV